MFSGHRLDTNRESYERPTLSSFMGVLTTPSWSLNPTYNWDGPYKSGQGGYSKVIAPFFVSYLDQRPLNP